MANTLLVPPPVATIELEAIEIKDEVKDEYDNDNKQQEKYRDNDDHKILPHNEMDSKDIKNEIENPEDNKIQYLISIIPEKEDEQVLTEDDNDDFLIDLTKEHKVEQEEEELTSSEDEIPDEDAYEHVAKKYKRYYNCIWCSKTFYRLSDLKKHKRTMHIVEEESEENKRPHKCSQCPKRFGRGTDLRTHLRTHTGEKPFKCELCDKSFSAKQNLTAHKKCHLGDDSKRYKCPLCDKKFLRNIDCKVHMRTHTKEKPYKCEMCDRGYSSKLNLNAHIDRKHSEIPRTITRQKPGPRPKEFKEKVVKKLELKDKLKIQLIREQNKILMIALNEQKLREMRRNPKFKCEFCNISHTTKQELYTHIQDHHPSSTNNERRFQCPHCSKTFVRNSDLNTHKRTHTGEKPFECDICQKSFVAKQNLIIHKKYHLSDESKKHKCDQCQKRFVSKADLKRHMRKHTGEKIFKCDICLKGLSSKLNVVNHIRKVHLANSVSEAKPRSKLLKNFFVEKTKLIDELQKKMEDIENSDNIVKLKESINILQQEQNSLTTTSLAPTEETIEKENKSKETGRRRSSLRQKGK